MARSVWTPPEEDQHRPPIDLMAELLRGITLVAAIIVAVLLIGLFLLIVVED